MLRAPCNSSAAIVLGAAIPQSVPCLADESDPMIEQVTVDPPLYQVIS
jgi:hypothetical protein